VEKLQLGAPEDGEGEPNRIAMALISFFSGGNRRGLKQISAKLARLDRSVGGHSGVRAGLWKQGF
jgi:hypothetical protein